MKAYLQCRYGAPHPKRNYDCGHEHRSSQAAIRCAKHIVNHDPDGWNVRIYLVIEDDGVIIDETAVAERNDGSVVVLRDLLLEIDRGLFFATKTKPIKLLETHPPHEPDFQNGLRTYIALYATSEGIKAEKMHLPP